jgi:glycosyltransferase involved in cell wall biosynthesis
MSDGVKTSLIIPAYNEEEAIPKVIAEIPEEIDEIILVDDGSTDKTYEVAKGLGIRVLRHEKNKGKVAAIKTGIKRARGDIIILTDADYTYPAEYMPVFIKKIEEGCDLVIGSRFMGGECNLPLLNKVGNKFLSIIATYISGVTITDAQSGFRAFRKELLKELDVKAKGLEFETEMTVKAAKQGYRVLEIPINYRKRIGRSKLNPLKDGYKMFIALNSIAIRETSVLAKTIMFPGAVLILAGLIFGVVSLLEYLSYGRPRHVYYPLITILLVLLGAQLFSLGLIIDNISKKIDRVYELMTRRK